MGSSAITSIAIGLGLMVIAVYFATDFSQVVKKFAAKVDLSYFENSHVKNALKSLNLDNIFQESAEKTITKKHGGDLLLTAEELRKYDGGPESGGLYLAILGEVFDVEKGAQHYRPGGGYAFFAGRDATRAYITGDFSEAGLSDDVSDLDDKSVASLEDWLSFYKEEYKPIGKLIGLYYDESGQPTELLLSVKDKLKKAQQNKWLEDKNKQMYPPCNSEWSKEKGSRVWCTKKSGGISREWTGLPRELHIPGKDPRCVCAKNYGPPSSPHLQDTNHGDLDDPNLTEYPGCGPSSESCDVFQP